MVAFDDFPQLSPVHVGIDLGGTDVGVAEEFLNHPEVGAADQKVGGETVPELVGMHILQAGDLRIFPHDLPDRDAFQGAAAEGEKQSLQITAIVETDEMGSEFGQILPSPMHRRIADRDDSLLRSLSGHGQACQFLMEFIEANRSDFAGSQPRRVHEFEDRTVSNPEAALIRPRAFDQSPHLSRTHDPGDSAPAMRPFQQSRRILRDAVVRGEPAKEHSDGRQMSSDAARFQPAIPTQTLEMLGKMLKPDLRDGVDGPSAKKRGHLREIPPVGLEGRGSQTGFDPSPGQEITNGSVKAEGAGLHE